MKLYLIDGTYELFRSHFGQPPREAPDGSAIGATYGIIASTLALLADTEVTHIAAAFDSVIPSFRNEVYPPYKNGEGLEPELHAQFPIAEEALRSIGVTVWPNYEFETDDAIATAALRWADEVDQVIVLSPDKDMAQLYGHPRIEGFDRRNRVPITESSVIEKFGVVPASIPDYLGLVGDTADGFPGLPGWGAKSASTILGRYGHLEDIPLDHNRWDVKLRGAEKLATTLRRQMGDALLYRFLAVLRPDVPIEESLDDLEWKGVPRKPFADFCEKHGLESLENRTERWID